MRTNEEFASIDDLFRTLLEDDSARGLLEQPEDNAIIPEVCGDLAKRLLGWSLLQGVTLGLPMVTREVDLVATQMFDGRFVSKFKDPSAIKYIFELFENDDPYGFRLLLMESRVTEEILVRDVLYARQGVDGSILNLIVSWRVRLQRLLI
ncbi:hypothetical protein V6N11_083728 [Hibiscus sabdariffa]|uniref:Uncharacterized protein n=1 Tax=Hibiscus sabdariffa TaxID=183260 RepID=A0ABR2QCD7_9ROSI